MPSFFTWFSLSYEKTSRENFLYLDKDFLVIAIQQGWLKYHSDTKYLTRDALIKHLIMITPFPNEDDDILAQIVANVSYSGDNEAQYQLIFSMQPREGLQWYGDEDTWCNPPAIAFKKPLLIRRSKRDAENEQLGNEKWELIEDDVERETILATYFSEDVKTNVDETQLASLYAESVTLIHYNVPDNENFVGRQDALLQLKNNLQVNNSTQFITGPKSIGKTTLASEYAKKNARSYRLVEIMTPDAIGSFDNSLRNLAYDINSLNYTRNLRHPRIDEEVNTAQLRNNIKKALQAIPDWLLILDGINDCAEIETIFPERNPDFRQHVIITSKLPMWDRADNVIKLGLLTYEESVELIQSKIEKSRKLKPSEINALPELILLAKRHPVLLTEASSYILCNYLTIEEYIHIIKGKNSFTNLITKVNSPIFSKHGDLLDPTFEDVKVNYLGSCTLL